MPFWASVAMVGAAAASGIAWYANLFGVLRHDAKPAALVAAALWLGALALWRVGL